MSQQIKRIYSGIQPSGTLHLGNYLGAIRHWVQLQDKCSSVLYSIVDLHSITVPQAPIILRENVRSMAVELLACGVDPNKSILYLQSQVPQHAELAWLLGCRTPSGWLNKMTQWKSKGATDNRDVVALGLFAYPVLMAADVLLYQATHVPVGDDQVQHLELVRDIAKSFNSTYGHTFPEPQPILGDVRRVMSLRNPLKKMSKSDNQELSTLDLSDSPDDIKRKIRKAVTDGSSPVTFDPETRPGVSNLVSIYSAISGQSHEEVCEMFEGKQTVDFKDSLTELLVEDLRPIRESIAHLRASPSHVDQVLRDGALRAGEIAESNWKKIKELVGLL